MVVIQAGWSTASAFRPHAVPPGALPPGATASTTDEWGQQSYAAALAQQQLWEFNYSRLQQQRRHDVQVISRAFGVSGLHQCCQASPAVSIGLVAQASVARGLWCPPIRQGMFQPAEHTQEEACRSSRWPPASPLSRTGSGPGGPVLQALTRSMCICNSGPVRWL